MSWFEILGVSENASTAEVKTARNRIVLEVHPDRHGQSDEAVKKDAEERTIALNAAFDEALRHIERRSAAASPTDSGSSGRRRRPHQSSTSAPRPAEPRFCTDQMVVTRAGFRARVIRVDPALKVCFVSVQVQEGKFSEAAFPF